MPPLYSVPVTSKNLQASMLSTALLAHTLLCRCLLRGPKLRPTPSVLIAELSAMIEALRAGHRDLVMPVFVPTFQGWLTSMICLFGAAC